MDSNQIHWLTQDTARLLMQVTNHFIKAVFLLFLLSATCRYLKVMFFFFVHLFFGLFLFSQPFPLSTADTQISAAFTYLFCGKLQFLRVHILKAGWWANSRQRLYLSSDTKERMMQICYAPHLNNLYLFPYSTVAYMFDKFLAQTNQASYLALCWSFVGI